MATRTVSTRNLIGRKSLSFIRPRDIAFSVADTKPNTRLYAFFDGVSVDAYVTPTGGTKGQNIVTDSAGRVSGIFSIPAMMFNTGVRQFKLQDQPTYDSSAVPGSLVGSATANYTASGMEETYQTTINTIETTEITIWVPVPAPAPRDPLAQSFFTYGVKDGCFVTAIEVYFQSKDASLPVTLELREMQNGYPSGTLVSEHAVVSLPPSNVYISTNASIPTKFTFSRPIRLEENRDYCFVLQANSNAYHVYTSKLGERSIENGKTIFEQPFIGSMFKSENNITWSAEQTEDIKFSLYRANFDTTQSVITWKSVAPTTNLDGEWFSVTSGSSVVTLKLPFQHGHQTGDVVVFSGNGLSYRGVSDTVFSSTSGFSVTKVDDYALTFSVGSNFASTGTLAAAGKLIQIDVDAQGSGYVSPSISFSGGGGSGAAASAIVSGGKIVGVSISNAGSGYTSTPTLTLTDASGTGAVLTPITDTVFAAAINRKFQAATAVIPNGVPPSTIIENGIRPSSETYTVGTLANLPLMEPMHLATKATLVNPTVETTAFGAVNSLLMYTRLTSTNPNVSPMLDLRDGAKLRLNNFIINGSSNSSSETVHATGAAQARYISQKTTVAVMSKDIRVLVEAASIKDTSFDVFVRTSVSGSGTDHTTLNWTKLTCKTATNLSSSVDEYKDYEFITSAFLPPFDVYDVKIVLYSEDKSVFPRIANYRAIVLAT